MFQIKRRAFVQAAAATSVAVALSPVAQADEPAATSIGPLLGHADPETAFVWFRAAAPGVVELRVAPKGAEEVQSFKLEALVDNDLCITWELAGLKPDTEYSAEVVASVATAMEKRPPCVFRTLNGELTQRVSLVFGSCASSTKFFEIWDRIAKVGADGVVLMGDTPYIDRTDLPSNRKSHREFLSISSLAELARTRPMWATWDDHDFGGNDSDGRVTGKNQIRQAFCEYRALRSYGDGKHGIYTSFRYGPVEVFLLDPRYFSQTEPSPVDPNQKTCLGKSQWEWLLKGLEKSTAPFKILASGMIWDDKKNKEKDDWETYAHEREALYDFISEKKISGVMLLSGDIHVSRHLTYPLKTRLGYDLHQCIVSPMHERIIPELNVPHPSLIWGEPIPNVFLQLVADATQIPATITANWFDIHGKLLYTFSSNDKELSAIRS